MGRLIYSTIASLDGFVEDAAGDISWGAPDEDVFRFINDLERPVGTYLYGRRMYETMLYWETAHTLADQTAVEDDFTAIWQAAEKVVYSRTLESVSSARTRIERAFNVQAVRDLMETTEQDMTVAGADLAAQAIALGLVDELQLFVVPVVLGAGKSWLPRGVRQKLKQLDCRRFAGGTVYLRYCLES
jgi:dihydrofolate reductase